MVLNKAALALVGIVTFVVDPPCGGVDLAIRGSQRRLQRSFGDSGACALTVYEDNASGHH